MSVKNTHFIQSRLYLYLKESFRESETKIQIIKGCFLLLLTDYFDNKLKVKPDLYTIEAFAGDMLFVANTPDEIKKIDPKLANALDIAADITYYTMKDGKMVDSAESNNLIQLLKNYLDTVNNKIKTDVRMEEYNTSI